MTGRLKWKFSDYKLVLYKTSPAQSNLGRPASQSPHWLQWDAPNSPPKLHLPFDDHHPHLIHPSLDRPHAPPQTASGSNQQFCHNTLCGQTDGPGSKSWLDRLSLTFSQVIDTSRSHYRERLLCSLKWLRLCWWPMEFKLCYCAVLFTF